MVVSSSQSYADYLLLLTPNASLQLLPEAGATLERTLEAVRCKALFGGVCRDDPVVRKLL
jgi:hypothetical protein